MSREAEYSSYFCDEHEDLDCAVCSAAAVDLPSPAEVTRANHSPDPRGGRAGELYSVKLDQDSE